MADLTHLNARGRARMVNVAHKEDTLRTAIAQSEVQMSVDVFKRIYAGEMKKGDVLEMFKALDKLTVIGPTYLVHKSGGKSGTYDRGALK